MFFAFFAFLSISALALEQIDSDAIPQYFRNFGGVIARIPTVDCSAPCDQFKSYLSEIVEPTFAGIIPLVQTNTTKTRPYFAVYVKGAETRCPNDSNKNLQALLDCAMSQIATGLKFPFPSKTESKSSTTPPPKTDPKSVIELDAGSFERQVTNQKDDEVWFVKFYAPWCGHCKALAPTWKELAKKMEGKVKIAQVDATVHQNLAQRFGVRGFPTLMLFKDKGKKPIQYNGRRELSDLSTFALQHAGSKAKAVQLTTQKQFSEGCETDLCFIAFLPHSLDSTVKERQKYLQVLQSVVLADNGLPMKVFWTEAGNSLELERALRLEFGWPAAVIVNKRKGIYTTHKGNLTPGELADFLTGVTTGRIHADSLPADLPAFVDTEKWEDKSAQTKPKSKTTARTPLMKDPSQAYADEDDYEF